MTTGTQGAVIARASPNLVGAFQVGNFDGLRANRYGPAPGYFRKSWGIAECGESAATLAKPKYTVPATAVASIANVTANTATIFSLFDPKKMFGTSAAKRADEFLFFAGSVIYCR